MPSARQQLMNKEELRRYARALFLLTPQMISEKSAAICAAILHSEAWQRARVVALFAPQAREPNVELLWPHAAGKTVAYPRVHDSWLELLQVDHPAALAAGRWKLREPARDEKRLVAPGELDLVLIPGVAFTSDGCRLGRGGGYYDRLLATLGPAAHKLGVCYHVQLVEEIPTEPHDQRLHAVVTEQGWFTAAAARPE